MSSLETQGQIVGLKTKIKTGGKQFDEQKYERKIRAPYTHQFQTAERILAPDWAENFSAPGSPRMVKCCIYKIIVAVFYGLYSYGS